MIDISCTHELTGYYFCGFITKWNTNHYHLQYRQILHKFQTIPIVLLVSIKKNLFQIRLDLNENIAIIILPLARIKHYLVSSTESKSKMSYCEMSFQYKQYQKLTTIDH